MTFRHKSCSTCTGMHSFSTPSPHFGQQHTQSKRTRLTKVWGIFSNHSLNDTTVYDDDVLVHGADYGATRFASLRYKMWSKHEEHRPGCCNCVPRARKNQGMFFNRIITISSLNQTSFLGRNRALLCIAPSTLWKTPRAWTATVLKRKAGERDVRATKLNFKKQKNN